MKEIILYDSNGSTRVNMEITKYNNNSDRVIGGTMAIIGRCVRLMSVLYYYDVTFSKKNELVPSEH